MSKKVGDMMISERIKMIRNHFKLSQSEFGERIGLSRGAVVNLEMNRLKNPGDQTLRYNLICREFGINEEWLRTGKGPMLSAKTEEEEFAIWAARHLKIDSDSFKRRFVRAMMNLSDDDWKVLEKYINDMTKDPAN